MPTSSIKLSITVQANLAAKYPAAAQARIASAVQAWVKADAARGITTLHVALDDAVAMKKLGATPITGKTTPVKVKRALDALCKKYKPDYVVILGGDEIVPMFRVANPSYDPTGQGDTDKDVPTDNPYACSTPYSAKNRKSYLVPDRVVGRIPDLTADKNPSWLTTSLKRYAAWKPQPRSHFTPAYAVVCDAWKGAGEACMRYLGLPESELQISPPTTDTVDSARTRLARKLHMIKCHGSLFDARFYGQKGDTYPVVLEAATLKPRITAGTLAAAMCCYGAQVYSPNDPLAQPPAQASIATTYLREGAVGFAGATMIAWVGVGEMACADWIICGYLKAALGGASLGRALLDAKQGYVEWLASQGYPTDQPDEKTLIEFVLLGDPSLHPVLQTAVPARAVAARQLAARAGSALQVQERQQRRDLRVVLAAQMRKSLPQRVDVKAPSPARVLELFKAVQGLLGKADAKLLEASRVHAEKLVRPASPTAPLPAAPRAARAAMGAAPPAASPRESIEYYWTGHKIVKGQRQISLLKVETDTQGVIMRTRLLHSA